MTSGMLRATLLALIPVSLCLSQCTPKDPPPPVPKVDSPATSSHTPVESASPNRPSGR